MSRMFTTIDKTFNPVVGCSHGCVYCWSKRLAETRLKHLYGDHRLRFFPERLKRIPKRGNIFIVDMGDLFCNEVPDEWIYEVLHALNENDRGEATYLFLTKNPERYHDFLLDFPRNSILGATIETDDDHLYLKNRISKAPHPWNRIRAMIELRWRRKMVSIEPIIKFTELFPYILAHIRPEFIYIGYDNYRHRLPEPSLQETMTLIDRLKSLGIDVRIKTLRRAWYEKHP